MSRSLRYSEDELRDQWAFIDRLVDSQSSALRSGVQDPEEEPVELTLQDPELLHELDVLRARVHALEAERRELLERLRIAEMVVNPAPITGMPPPRVISPPPPPPPPAGHPRPRPRTMGSRVGDWWKRISR